MKNKYSQYPKKYVPFKAKRALIYAVRRCLDKIKNRYTLIKTAIFTEFKMSENFNLQNFNF